MQQGIVDYQSPNSDFDVDWPVGSGGMVATAVSFAPATFEPAGTYFGEFVRPWQQVPSEHLTPEASIGSNGAISAPVLGRSCRIPHPPRRPGCSRAFRRRRCGRQGRFVRSCDIALAPTDLASLVNPPAGSVEASYTNSSIGPDGATAAQVQQALDESGLSVNGSGIRVGVLSDSFNDLGGAAADEADGALPPAADIDVIKDLASGGTDEGRAMMQIIHDIAPGADLAFYTAFDSEQDFANGILALAAAGCKVIVDDVSYFDEPFFQNGVVAQAIQTVEAEGVTYVTAAGNDAEQRLSGRLDAHLGHVRR